MWVSIHVSHSLTRGSPVRMRGAIVVGGKFFMFDMFYILIVDEGDEDFNDCFCLRCWERYSLPFNKKIYIFRLQIVQQNLFLNMLFIVYFFGTTNKSEVVSEKHNYRYIS